MYHIILKKKLNLVNSRISIVTCVITEIPIRIFGFGFSEQRIKSFFVKFNGGSTNVMIQSLIITVNLINSLQTY